MKSSLTIIIFSVFVALIGCSESDSFNRQPEVADYEGTIVAVGDSLTEGLGVAEEYSYPALLEKKLQTDGYRFRVVNAGISAETSSGTLGRIKWILTLQPDIVILVIGANDGLRGIDPAFIKTNIRKIVRTLKDNNVIVVLGAMQIVQNLGKDYTTAFAQIYPEVARAEKISFIPFFLEGVAATPELNQADGIHPTADGYRVIVDGIYAHVLEAIKRYRAKM